MRVRGEHPCRGPEGSEGMSEVTVRREMKKDCIRLEGAGEEAGAEARVLRSTTPKRRTSS